MVRIPANKSLPGSLSGQQKHGRTGSDKGKNLDSTFQERSFWIRQQRILIKSTQSGGSVEIQTVAPHTLAAGLLGKLPNLCVPSAK